MQSVYLYAQRLKDTIFRQHTELEMSAWFFLAVIIGTTVTFWNMHNAAIHRQSPATQEIYERRATFLFSLKKYASVISQLASEAISAYRGGQVSLLGESEEPQKADRRIGGGAHLGYQYFLISPPGTKNLTRWSLDHRLRSYVNGSVGYNGGCLVVQENGFYYVYSQVSFVKALRDWAANQSAVTHEVVRLSNTANDTQTLLRVRKTHSWDKKLRCSLDASYLGATFYLQKGDRIFVTVSDANFIWQSPRRTYFGMRSLVS